MLSLRSLFMLVAVALVFGACSKDEETPTYQQDDFIGVWNLVSTEGEAGVDYNQCSTKKDNIEITEEMFSISSYSEECFGGSIGTSYEFDGKNTLTLNYGDSGDMTATVTILSLTENSLKIKTSYDFDGMSSSEVAEYSR